jgi:uncharacterized protein YndB with AHSA1/START domain
MSRENSSGSLGLPRRTSRNGSRLRHGTAIIFLEPHGRGTKYTALAIHGEEAGRRKHEEMGFHEGWGKALDQLVAVVKRM